MRTASADLQNAIASESTTLCRLWRVTRADGTVLRFTDADRDVTVGAETFRADISFTCSAILTTSSFQAAQSVTLNAIMDDAGLKENDLRARRYDGAQGDVLVADYAHPAYGTMTLFRGVFGVIKITDKKRVTIEIQSQGSQARTIGHDVYQATCRASLGDAKCKFDLEGDPAYTNPGGTGDRTASITVTTTATLGAGTASNWVDGGVINNSADSAWFVAGQSGREVRIDLGSPFIVNELTWQQQNTTTHGTWQVEGSPDGVAWTTLSSGVLLGNPSTHVIAFANTTPYRYYRLLQTAGVTSDSPWINEITLKINLPGRKVPFTVSAYNAAKPREVVATELGQADDHWALGYIEWLTGANAGTRGMVEKSDQGDTSATLVETPLNAVAVGDTGIVRLGCDKLPVTCRDRFDNIVNFRGEPFVPTPDILTPRPTGSALPYGGAIAGG